MVAVMFQACKPAIFYAFIGVVNLLLFSTYTLTTGNPLTPAIVFTTISLMSNVRLTATGFILNGVVGFQEAKIAFSRIQVSAQQGMAVLVVPVCMLNHIFNYIGPARWDDLKCVGGGINSEVDLMLVGNKK